ncbi:HAD hydrolase, family IIID [Cryptococcus sp. DSM 104549]
MSQDPPPATTSSPPQVSSSLQPQESLGLTVDPEDELEGQNPPIAARPDVESAPSEGKKPKLFHVSDGDEDGRMEVDVAADDTPPGEAINDTAPAIDQEGREGGEGAVDKEATPIVAAVPLAEEVEVTEEWWDLRMQWSGKTFELKVGGNDLVYDFRAHIESLTNVPRDGQKLIGLLPGSKGKLGAEHDALRFATLGVKKGGKFVMVGTTVEERFRDRAPAPEIQDDFDVSYSSKAGDKAVAPADDPRNKRKVQEIIDKVPITVMNEPREGKKLLVLDLDYTMVDTKPMISGALPSSECARPGLHEFLELVYPHYDIVIWSQTHWRWLETKLVELDLVGNEERNYKISFVSDRTTMFPVFTQRNGQPYKHEVKPLAYFWAAYPHWSPKNTIHIDDLARNFALNPGEGLRIRAFNKAGQPEGLADRELKRLGIYLVNIATNLDDFTTVDHGKWKKTVPRQS